MKKALPLLLLAAALAADASAAWIYDAGANTLTNDKTHVVLAVVVHNAGNKWLRIARQTDTSYAFGDLDFSEEVKDTTGATWYVSELANEAFRGCSGVTGFVAPSTLTYVGQRAFQESGIVHCDLSRATSLNEIQQCMFQDAYNLEGEIVIPDSVTKFGVWMFYQAGKNGNGFSVKFGASAAPTSIDEHAFPNSGLTSIDMSKLTGLTSIAYKAFRGSTKLSRVDLPATLTSLPAGAFNYHRQGEPMLSVYARNCPISDVKQNPFSEMFGDGNSYKVTDADVEKSNVTLYVPIRNDAAKTENWNDWAAAWEALAAGSAAWNDDATKKIFTLPASKSESGLWITDYAKTGVTWSDAAVVVKFWDDPEAAENGAAVFIF